MSLENKGQIFYKSMRNNLRHLGKITFWSKYLKLYKILVKSVIKYDGIKWTWG
jgi:hypothetical protein